MMSEARFKQIMSGMNTPAQKVYDDVPIGEAWTAQQIYKAANMTRNVSFEIVRGCLDVLANAGLVHQTVDSFQRAPIRERTDKPKLALADLKSAMQPNPPNKKESSVSTPKPVPKETVNVVDTLGRLAQHLVATALRHQQEMRELADLISDAAVEVQAGVEKSEEDLAKYRQLQDLLKGIRE